MSTMGKAAKKKLPRRRPKPAPRLPRKRRRHDRRARPKRSRRQLDRSPRPPRRCRRRRRRARSLAAYDSGKTVVLLFVHDGGIDDRLVETATKASALSPTSAIFIVPAKQIARYAAITARRRRRSGPGPGRDAGPNRNGSAAARSPPRRPGRATWFQTHPQQHPADGAAGCATPSYKVPRSRPTTRELSDQRDEALGDTASEQPTRRPGPRLRRLEPRPALPESRGGRGDRPDARAHRAEHARPLARLRHRRPRRARLRRRRTVVDRRSRPPAPPAARRSSCCSSRARSPPTSSRARSPSATASTTSTSPPTRSTWPRRTCSRSTPRAATRRCRSASSTRRRCWSRWPTRPTCSPSTTSRSRPALDCRVAVAAEEDIEALIGRLNTLQSAVSRGDHRGATRRRARRRAGRGQPTCRSAPRTRR